MLKLMDLLREGVHDKGIFKAVFMAGGPGSGKTFINSELFGIPKYINVSVGGLKVVNSDKEFKFLLRKYGFNPAQMDQYGPDWFQDMTAPGGSGLRDYAKELTKLKKQGYMDGKLGMIIDGTGDNFKKLKRRKEELEKQGYDTYMIFVWTSLETALHRNKARAEKGDRPLPEKIVRQSWKDVQKNLGALKAVFGNNFVRVDNDRHLDAKEAKHKFSSLIKGHANKWVNSPIKNKIGQKWVQDQMKLQKAGIK